ncbi:MAG TPA: PAS domain-containing protein [Acidimicrobiia bacterium]|nr:PAS domain-containing protein [Acidimicrobiia bacterium]
MPQHPIEIILLRQWASMMSVPIWVTDAAGDLVYFNEPTEGLIGLSFEDAGDISVAELSDRFELCDLDGSRLPDHDRPLVVALQKQQPAQRLVRIRSHDGVAKVISDTAVPIVGEGDRLLGAMVILWDAGEGHA